jgi:hypothetical protein
MHGARSVTVLAALALVAAGGLAGAQPARADDFTVIGGLVYEDINGDTNYDPEDRPLEGFVIDLGDGDQLLAQAVTDASGRYAFGVTVGLPYTVFPEGFHVWVPTPGGYDVPSTGVDSGALDFAMFRAGYISGHILEDQTGDGFSVDDTALQEPVLVDLYVSGNPSAIYTVTAQAGQYAFDPLYMALYGALGPGTYTVKERVPAGYTLTAEVGAAIGGFSGFRSEGNDFDNYFNSLAITMTGIQPVEGAAFTGTVASFRAGPAAVASDFSATIVWGDGTSSAGGITTDPSGGFFVSGQHTFTEEGLYNLELTVNSATGLSATGSESVAVADALLHASGQALPATRSAAFSGSVATFTDDDPNGEVGDYSASISWGDGTTSSGTVSAGFVVSGSHTFGEGRFTITTTIHDLGGASAVATCTITVDLTAPTTSATVTRLRNQAVVTLTATDNLTGVGATYYTINGGPTQQYSGPFALKGNKSTTVRYWSVDGVGNTETAHTVSV